MPQSFSRYWTVPSPMPRAAASPVMRGPRLVRRQSVVNSPDCDERAVAGIRLGHRLDRSAAGRVGRPTTTVIGRLYLRANSKSR